MSYNKKSAVAEMGNSGHKSNTVAWADAYLHTKWHLSPSRHLTTTHMDRISLKKGGTVPFRGGGAGTPSNTMSLGLRPTPVASGILIHPALW